MICKTLRLFQIVMQKEKMKYKSHPIYDESNAQDWLTLGELINHPQLNQQRDELEKIAYQKIVENIKPSDLIERPYPDVNDFLFYPFSDSGYRVFIEFVFYQKENENTPDTDTWWVIINCPPQGGTYAISFGWVVN